MTPFVPHRLLRGPHAQTLAGRFLRSERGVVFRREQWPTPDGDILEVDFADVPGRTWSQLGGRAPIALLLHGLEGSARTGYAHETYKALAERGIRGVGLNFRSCGGATPKAKRMYHAGETSDPGLVLEGLHERFGDVPLFAIGFSLGANVLLKLLGEGSASVQAAAVVSPPFDLSACVHRIEQGFSRVYSRHLSRGLKGKLRLRLEDFRGLDIDAPAGLKGRTLRDFDQFVTAPLHGFHGADDYYARSSSGGFVAGIQVPTLILRSLDDPFLAADDVPHEVIAKSPHLDLRLSEHGGHVAFLASSRRGGVRCWAEETAADWFAERI